MSFPQRLKKERTRNKLTQEKLSQLLDMKRSTYAKYETGENQPSYETLKKLATIFHVTTDYLLGMEKKTEEHTFSYSYVDKSTPTISETEKDYYPFFDMEKWNALDEEDREDIKKYFEWVHYKASKRK